MKKLTAYILSLVIICTAAFSVSAVSGSNEAALLSDDGIWEYVVSDGKFAEITAYTGSEKIVSIPETINDYTVTSIGSAAFYNSDIEKIHFPSSIDSVGWWAFYGCKKLSEVSFNIGLNSIEYGAFMNCRNLKSVIIPYTVSSIGEDAFAVNCSTSKNISDHYSKKTVSRQNYFTYSEFIISGYGGTYAETFAKLHNLTFNSESDVLFGDADLDGSVDNDDIILLNKYIKGKTTLNGSQLRNSDVDGNSSVTMSDIALIGKYIRNLIPLCEFPVAKNFEESPDYLNGKTLYCDGDSVAKGTGTNIFGNDFYSYCNYISEKYNMQMVNNAVAGTTIAKQKNKTKPNNKSIFERVREMNSSYDVVLLEGGFNDLFQNIKIGKMTDINDKSGNYDEYTTAGALESICFFLNNNYADSIKLFVLCHTRNANPNQYKYWNVITEILDKWGIDYVDMSSETDLCDINDEISTQYFMYNKYIKKGDGIHPLAYAAKKIYGPVISEKLNEIAGENFTVNFDETEVELGLSESYFQAPVTSEYPVNTQLKWSSDNPLVACVNSNGEVTARGIGTTSIRLCTSDGKTASFSVTVKLMAMDLELDSTNIELNMGENCKLGTRVMKGTAAYHKTFYSSDSSVAIVSGESGVITAISQGKAVITCKTPIGVIAECTVTVK